MSRQTLSVVKEVQVAFLLPPLVYVFWFVASLLVGLFFYLGLVVSPEPNLRLLTVNLALSNIVLMPMMGMRMFAEEDKQGTLEMMLTLLGSLWTFVGRRYGGHAVECHHCDHVSIVCIHRGMVWDSRLGRHLLCVDRTRSVHSLLFVRRDICICSDEGAYSSGAVGCIVVVTILDGGFAQSKR